MRRDALTDVEALPILAKIAAAEFGNDPGGAYRAAHAHRGPGIFQMPDGDGVVVTAHDALADLMVHPALGAQNRRSRQSGAGESGSLARLDDNSPFFMDEPLHAPMAAAVYQPMSPARQDTLVETITEIATNAMDDLLEHSGGDLVVDYAMVIAATFWTQFLGLSSDQAPLPKACSATVVPMLQFSCTQAQIRAANEGAEILLHRLNEHYATIKGRSGATLLHRMAPTVDDCELPNAPADAAAVAAAMTFDGIDSVAGATANVLFTCLSHPGQLALLRQDLNLIPAAWREAMRVEPSVLGLQRSPRQIIAYKGVRIPADVNVLMLWAAGNRDPRQFDAPDEFKITRPKKKLLSFGGGSRICKGRYLAMLQAQIALDVLLKHAESIELLMDKPSWSSPGMLRAIQSMPVRLK
jgi:cytochrome P450